MSNLIMYGRCSVTTRGPTEIDKVYVNQNCILRLRGEAKIHDVILNDHCQLLSWEASWTKLVVGNDHCSLIFQGKTRILSAVLTEHSQLLSRESARVQSLVGRDHCKLFFQGKTNIEAASLRDHALLFCRGRSKIRAVVASDWSLVAMMTVGRPSSLLLQNYAKAFLTDSTATNLPYNPKDDSLENSENQSQAGNSVNNIYVEHQARLADLTRAYESDEKLENEASTNDFTTTQMMTWSKKIAFPTGDGSKKLWIRSSVRRSQMASEFNLLRAG
ncbi:hypothetical protein BDP81DRAFT_435930 [Colletotrichum phormii]|uniref:Uncharacterized protein n=1 Tax=Colletotrichum phormii TaxID=359342 RepID=A0AAI9ZJQ7_9PEZI|nr:uncharacterized protein BDP81DRAFT_435930 [Colletotrichum phormii]KAK1625498.1 hypothetical protein BDP81DRAFT_435930 [Colletotrichum phormii]